MSHVEHKAQAPTSVACSVLTVSDSRTPDTDTSGRAFRQLRGGSVVLESCSGCCFQEIGAAAMLTRATAGTAARKAIFVLPGSEHAVRLAMTRLILPELGHVVQQLSK